MKFFNYKKFITIGCIVIVSATMFQPKPAQALFPDWLNAGIQVIGHGIQGALLGIDSAANTLQAGLDSVKQVINGLPIEYGPVNQGLSIAITSCDLIGGNVTAISELDALTSPSSPAFDPRFQQKNPAEVLPKLPGLTNPRPVPDPNAFPSGGTVAGDSTITGVGSIPSIYQDKIRTENSTVVGIKTIETPVVTSATNLDPLGQSLVTIGDKAKTNLTLALTKKLGLMRYQKACYSVIEKSLNSSLIIAGWNEQLKAAYIDALKKVETRSATVNRNVLGIEDSLNQARQEVFTAIAGSVAANINEQRTTETIDALKPQLTVGNYEQTADALSKQVYAPKMIKEKYSQEPNTEYILGILLDKEIATDSYAKQQAEETARAAVRTVLSDTAGCFKTYDYGTDFTDFNSILEASSTMQPGCDEDLALDSYKSQFGDIMTASKQAAQTEVTNGGGIISTRSCVAADDAFRQQRIDVANAGNTLRIATYNREQADKNGISNKQDYIDKVNAEKQAIADLKAKLNGGVEELCGPIKDAGGYTKSVLEQYAGQLMSSPGFSSDNPTASINKADRSAEVLLKLIFGISNEPKSAVGLLTTFGQSILLSGMSNSSASAAGSTIKNNGINTTALGNGTGTTPVAGLCEGGMTICGIGSGSGSQVKGDSTNISSDVKTVPYTSPRGDFGINRGGR